MKYLFLEWYGDIITLKTLPPTLREKKRYISFKIISEKELTGGEVVNLIRLAIIDYCGILGCSKANPWLIEYNCPKGLLRITRSEVDFVIASLISVKEYKQKKINIVVLGVSGTILKSRKKYLKEPHEKYYKVIQRRKREKERKGQKQIRNNNINNNNNNKK